MTTKLTDRELEARLIATFEEVIPRLRRAPEHAAASSPAVLVDVAMRRDRVRSSTRRRHVAVAAAAVLTVGTGALWATARGRTPVASTAPAVTAAAASTAGPAAAGAGPADSPLVAALGFDTQPLVVADGWAYDGASPLQPVSANPPSATCPGCGTDRLVVAADGALFDGPILTAWIADVPYAPETMDWPVRIGGIAGRFMGAPDGSLGPWDSKVTVMWPVGPDRTAYVEAIGLSNDQVFAMAAALDVSGDKPAIVPPAGFHVVEAPLRSGASYRYGTMDNVAGRQTSPTYRTLQVYATNAGLQGLVDWRLPTGRLLMEGWTPRVIDGTTVAFDDRTADPESAGNASAIWVAGDWAYVVIGQRFTSGDEFVAAVEALRLGDEASFAAATADAATASLEPVDESGRG